MTDTLAAAAAAAVVAVVALRILFAMIAWLRRVADRPTVATLPVRPEQDVELPESGDWVLHVQGPLFTMRFRGLDWQVVERATGMPLAVRRIVFRERRSGLRRVSVSLRRFTAPHAGTYVLRTTGLRPSVDYADCALLVTRPIGVALPLAIVGTVVAAVLVVASVAATIALTALALSGRQVRDLADLRVAQPVPERSARPHEETATSPASLPQSGGRRLRGDRAAATRWHTITWASQGMTADVPAGWAVHDAGSVLEVRSEGPPAAYFLGHVTPPLGGVAAEQLSAIHRRTAADDLATDVIDGWADLRLGALPGVLTIERRDGDDRLITWLGARSTPMGAVTVTLLLGVADGGFDAAEPVLGAILHSVRFER